MITEVGDRKTYSSSSDEGQGLVPQSSSHSQCWSHSFVSRLGSCSPFIACMTLEISEDLFNKLQSDMITEVGETVRPGPHQ